MNIKVTSDSTCDLSKELLDKYNIDISPLYVTKGGKAYRDGVDITPSDIFEHVANGGEICSTSAINIETYIEFFRQYSKKYDAVIHINIGSEFSSCYQNACIAAKEFTNVYVINSENLSAGHGLVVLKVCDMISEGKTPEEICTQIKKYIPLVEASFIIGKIDYLHKGGRCSSVAAIGANILKLKPCINVIDGKMSVGKKYRGAFDVCIQNYASERLSERTDIDWSRMILIHTDVSSASYEAAKRAILSNENFRDVIELTANCTISCHCGPDTLGIMFARKE